MNGENGTMVQNDFAAYRRLQDEVSDVLNRTTSWEWFAWHFAANLYSACLTGVEMDAETEDRVWYSYKKFKDLCPWFVREFECRRRRRDPVTAVEAMAFIVTVGRTAAGKYVEYKD